jgi:hypothetical protein
VGSIRGRAALRLLWAVIGSGALLAVACVLSAAASTFMPSPSSPALEVGTASSTVKTAVRDASDQVVTQIPFNEYFHDSAVVSGGSGTPTGTVTFRLFGSADCSGTAQNVSSAFTLRSGAVDATTFAFTGAVNTFSFQATYSGNATYAKKKSACEPIEVVKAKPSVTTHVRNAAGQTVSSVVIGADAHDFVQVNPNVSGASAPTGTVTLQFFRDGTCSTVVATSSAKDLVNGKVDVTSFKFTSSHPALLAFRATYNGDGWYTKRTGGCEVFAVKAQPTVASTPMDFSTGNAVLTAPYGDFIADHVKVSGAWGTPTGTVTVSLYAGATCVAPAVATATGTLVNGTVNLIPAFGQHLLPGDHSFAVQYPGDTTYAAVPKSPCSFFKIEPAPSTLTATIRDANGTTVASVPVGTVVHVHAQVSGGFGTPTGKVTDVILAPGCQGLGVAGSATLSGGAADITNRTATATTVGTNIAFAVGYAGDSIYAKSASACVEVAVTAANSTPKPATPPPAPSQPVATPVASVGGSVAPSELPAISAAASLPASAPGATSQSPAGASGGPQASAAPVSSTSASGLQLPDLIVIAIAVLVMAVAVALYLRGRSRRGKASAAP